MPEVEENAADVHTGGEFVPEPEGDTAVAGYAPGSSDYMCNVCANRPSLLLLRRSHNGGGVFQPEIMSRQRFMLQDLQPVSVLGRGNFGVVQKVLHQPTGRVLALKEIALELSEKVKKQVIGEIEAMAESSSRHVVSFYEAYYKEARRAMVHAALPPATNRQDKQGKLYIALEYMDAGSLLDIYKAIGLLPERVVGQIALMVLKGLDYLHRARHLIHRDIKPSNLLTNLHVRPR